MKTEHSVVVNELLGFADETAGRIMTPDFFALDEDLTISEAITALQKRSEEFEMSFYIYVVDSRNHLLGVVSLRQLLLNPPSTPLRKIMIGDVIKVTTDTDQEEVARLVATYNLLAVAGGEEEDTAAVNYSIHTHPGRAGRRGDKRYPGGGGRHPRRPGAGVGN